MMALFEIDLSSFVRNTITLPYVGMVNLTVRKAQDSENRIYRTAV